MEYCRAAAGRLAGEVADPQFFVFSDEPAWVREHPRLPCPMTVVDVNDEAHDYEDLRLLAQCWHHIIANSSFSWWGAWLGEKSGQIVIAPRRFYGAVQAPMPDFYPESWRIL